MEAKKRDYYSNYGIQIQYFSLTEPRRILGFCCQYLAEDPEKLIVLVEKVYIIDYPFRIPISDI